ncbi:MAG: PD40 domain-containing protein [Ignavibacteriae bacterium]|nr:PD40 domain-containing protein [Ignavibacteriota bacterium]MCB9242086.1 PD40 domain-containing protein [Ignavibacteriales bacterium]
MKSTVFIHIALLFILLNVRTSQAQFVDFGRNKVQYSDFKWNTLTTEHFTIYYYEGAKDLAEQGAFFAEESYTLLQQKFKHSLNGRVPLIFYSSPLHFKQTNTTPGFVPDGVGGFFEFIKGRVVIPFEGSLGQFKHVIRHELVHVFMTSKLISEQKIHGQVGDKDVPLWFTEGLAEYWSSEWDTQSDMALKDAVLHKYIVGLDNWEKLYGSYLMYKMGQKALEYTANTYGEEKVLQLMENFYQFDNFSEVMKLTIGKDYEEFDKGYLSFLDSLYFSDSAETDNPSEASIDIYSKGFAHKPVHAVVNGKDEIYYIGNEYGYTSVFRVDLHSTDRSPDLVVEGENSDEFEQFHFFRTGMDASPDGKLAFITQKGETDAIHIYDMKHRKKTADYSFKDIVNIGSPAWSPDGKKLLFPAREFTGESDLFILDLRTEKLTRLTNDFYDDRDPDFSPDGNYVVFSSDRTSYGYKNRYNLFLYDLRSGEISYLTNGDRVDYSPQFSPDGKKIVFTSNATGAQNIWMIDLTSNITQRGTQGNDPDTENPYENLSGVQMKRLTNFTTAAYDPRWIGNDTVIFSSFENRSIAIRMIDSINTKADNSTAVIDIDYTDRGINWVSGRIEGVPEKNNKVYKKDFSLDFATTSVSSDPVFGTNAGGIISLSDMLGNEKYYFLLYNNSDDNSEFWKSFNVAVSKVSLEKRLNYAYGVFHLSGKRYDLAESDESYYERLFGGYASFSYPLSQFRRFEASVSLAQSFKDIDITDKERSTLLTNRISYVKDNALWGMTGPVDGERLNLTLGYTTDIENSNVNYYSLLFDYRKYFRLAQSITFATRGQYFMNEGKNPRRFFMGGTWSLRGWTRNGLKGTKMWLTNAELRFPILNLYDKDLPLGFNYIIPGIRGALFFDAGNTWDEFDNYGETLGSIGASLKINTFGFLILRYDVGKRIENNFTHLQSGLFHQFFFGWDF